MSMNIPGISRTPTIVERSTDYVPLKGPIDKTPFESMSAQILRSIENAANEDAEMVERMNALADDVRTVQQLTSQRDRIQTALDEAEANAVVDDTVFDGTAHREKIKRLSDEIRIKGKRAGAAKGALAILQGKRDDLSEKTTKLRAELDRTNQQWMEARHAELIEQFRFEMHGLHSIVAQIIAIEQTGSFRFEKGWDLVERMGAALRYDSPFRPDWFSVGKRREFPGFAAAFSALKAELEGATE